MLRGSSGLRSCRPRCVRTTYDRLLYLFSPLLSTQTLRIVLNLVLVRRAISRAVSRRPHDSRHNPWSADRALCDVCRVVFTILPRRWSL